MCICAVHPVWYKRCQCCVLLADHVCVVLKGIRHSLLLLPTC